MGLEKFIIILYVDFFRFFRKKRERSREEGKSEELRRKRGTYIEEEKRGGVYIIYSER